MSGGPKVDSIRKHTGVAGQISFVALVTYPGEAQSRTEFVGNTQGGPIVAISPSGVQTFVRDPERFGTFGEEWVRKFFASGD